MSEINVLLIILFTSLIGYILIRGFNLVKNPLTAFSFSYGLGIGLIYIQMFLYSNIGISWQRSLLIFPWVVICAWVLIKKRNNFKQKFPKKIRLQKIEYLLISLILILVVYTIFEALIRPAVTWDSWATWLMEAKAFFIGGRLYKDIFVYLGSDYPLMLKLYWVFVYNLLGKFNDTSILLTSAAFYVFSLLMFYASIRSRIGRARALLFTFLLASIQVLIRQGGRFEAGEADLPLGYFCFASVILLLEYIKDKSYKTFLLLSVFLAIVTLTKQEGLPFAIVVALIGIFYIYKNKLYSHLLLLAFWIFPILLWRIFRLNYHLRSYASEIHQVLINVLKTTNSISGTFKSMINVKGWGFLWILYFYSLFLFPFKKNRELMVLNIIVLSQLILYLATYIIWNGFNPESSIDRLFAHIAPIVLYAVALQFGKNEKFI